MAENTRMKIRVAGIVLAAGQSNRLGRTKQLLPFRDTTLLGQTIENAGKSQLDEIIVVLGHDAQSIQDHIDFKGIKVVVNENYQQGQSSSIKAGLAHISKQSEAAMFLLGDQPLVDKQVINALIKGYGESHKPIVIPMFEGMRGNPVIISGNLFGELTETIHGDAGARVLFSRHREKTHFMELGHRCIHVDVDTMEDYQSLLATDQSHENI